MPIDNRMYKVFNTSDTIEIYKAMFRIFMKCCKAFEDLFLYAMH
jgi:hypothetical protein